MSPRRLIAGTTTSAPSILAFAQLAKIGLVPGNNWDISTLDPAVAQEVAAAPKAAIANVMAYESNAGKIVNGWQIAMPAGVYGTDYLNAGGQRVRGELR